jgi:hypothetical protein
MVVFAISNLLRKVVNSKLVLANIAVLIVAFVLQSYHPITSILEKHRVQVCNMASYGLLCVAKMSGIFPPAERPSVKRIFLNWKKVFLTSFSYSIIYQIGMLHMSLSSGQP